MEPYNSPFLRAYNYELLPSLAERNENKYCFESFKTYSSYKLSNN